MPEIIRVTKIREAKIKIVKVTLAFSLMPRMLSPATTQMVIRTRAMIMWWGRWKKEVALSTALTAEIQAVRM